MTHLEPLPGPPTLKQWKGLDARSGFLTMLLIGSVFLYYALGVEPLLDRIQHGQGLLCNGTQNAIFAIDPYQFVYSAKLDADDDVGDNVNPAAELAITEMVKPWTVPIRNFSSVEGYFALGFPQSTGDPPSFLQQVSVMTNTEASAAMQEFEIGAPCSDGLSAQVKPFMEIYMKDYGVEEVEDCSDMQHKCFEVPAVRVVCPKTCGCDHPFGNIFEMDSNGGCPPKCLESGRWTTVMQSQPCKDMTVEYLRTTEYWPLWIKQFDVLGQLVSVGYEEVRTVICADYGGNCTKMLESGCDFVRIWNRNVLKFLDVDHLPDVCTGRFFGTGLPVMWRPLAPICPEQCGCIENPDQVTHVQEDSTVNICPTSCYADSTGVDSNQPAGPSPEIDNDDDDDKTNASSNDSST